MTTLTNSIEGITPSGTTPTNGNSGTAPDSAFDAAAIGAPPSGGTLASDSAHAAHGLLSMKFATAATSGTCFVGWATSMGTKTTTWFRLYLFATANPAAPIRLYAALTGSTLCGALLLTTTGTLRFVNTAGSTVVTTTATIPLSAWCRIEGFLTGSATVGQVEVKLFSSPDSLTATETQTSSAAQNTNAAPNAYRFGISAALANVGPYWQDDLGLSDAGYLGPAVPAASTASPAATYVPALIAAGVMG